MIIHRLMETDGSVKKVGYRIFVNGETYYRNTADMDADLGDDHGSPIKHDRIDRYTGVEVDGVMLFERDKVEGNNHGGRMGTVAMELGHWMINWWYKESVHLKTDLYQDRKNIKIVGYEGDGKCQ